MRHLETLRQTLEKHFSPLNCTSPHFSRKPFANKGFETNFFNEIKDLGVSLDADPILKIVLN
jgi:hypothetical protein